MRSRHARIEARLLAAVREAIADAVEQAMRDLVDELRPRRADGTPEVKLRRDLDGLHRRLVGERPTLRDARRHLEAAYVRFVTETAEHPRVAAKALAISMSSWKEKRREFDVLRVGGRRRRGSDDPSFELRVRDAVNAAIAELRAEAEALVRRRLRETL
jgi:hypothetical protein